MFIHFSILVLCLATVFGQEGQKSYDGWVLLKVQAKNPQQVDFLNSLRESEAHGELQIWQQGNLERPFDIFVSPDAKDLLLASLDGQGIQHEYRSKNVQRAIDAEKIAAPRNRAAVGANSQWFTKFLKLDEINSAVDSLVAANPSIMSVETIGKGHEGRPIRVVKVTSNKKTTNKPGIWIDGGIHAREWASPATVLYMLNKLVNGYNSNYTQYIDSATWYFVVVLNPDGYDYTHKYDRMWRKNRRNNGRAGCEGVDLNRNFDISFGGGGTSGDPCDDTYRGASAFSEPESRAVRDYVLSHKDLKAVITIHAYSQMWFVPFGDRYDHYPADYDKLTKVAKAGADALYKRFNTKYDVGTAADLLYEAAGGSDDWSKDKAKIEYVYCLELRPAGNAGGNGFLLSPREIVQTGEETFDGIMVVANAAIWNKY